MLLCLIPFLLYLLYRLLRGKKPEEERGFLLEPDAELAAAEVADEEEEISTKHDQLAEIERIARQQPKEVAKLIETWLHEE